MKKKFFLYVFYLTLQITLRAQSFYNGSFETNSLSICTLSLADTQFNSSMSHVTAFGKTYIGSGLYIGNTSIQDSSCSVVPQDGQWCVGLRSSFGTSSDAIALELTDSLVPGTMYYLSFYVYGNLGFQNYQLNVDIGESLTNSNVGTYLYSAIPNYLEWKNASFSFIASQKSKFITAKIASGYHSWCQVDNFIISKFPIGTGIYEYNVDDFFSLYPNPASGNLNIHFANDPEPCTLEIYNEHGEAVIKKQTLNATFGYLDVSLLSEGPYVIRLTNSMTTMNKKIMISR